MKGGGKGGAGGEGEKRLVGFQIPVADVDLKVLIFLNTISFPKSQFSNSFFDFYYYYYYYYYYYKKGLSVLIERHTSFPEEFLPETERSKYSVIKGRLDSVQVSPPSLFFPLR